MNKKFILLVVLAAASIGAQATSNQHRSGYIKKNGTHVAPHNATKPNHTKRDNYSHQGNVNPFTGKKGYKK